MSCTVKDSLCIIYVSLCVLDFSFSTSYLVLRLFNHFFLVCCYLISFVKVSLGAFFFLFSVSFTSFSISNFLLLLFNVFWCSLVFDCLRLVFDCFRLVFFGLRLVFFGLRLVFLGLCLFYFFGRFIKLILSFVNLTFCDFLFDLWFCFFLRNNLLISCRCYCRYFLCVYVSNSQT